MDRKWTKQLSMREKFWLWLRHSSFICYWCLYDLLLSGWVRLRNIDYVGVYVYVMSKSEWVWWFRTSDVACGYNACAMIKIGFNAKWFTIDGTMDIINHEVLHQVLWLRIGDKAYRELDNIHKVWQYKEIDGERCFYGIDFIE